MMVIRNMKRNKNDKIREYAKAEAENIKLAASEKKEIVEAEAGIRKEKILAEAVHFIDVQRLRKEVQKEAREYKDLINL